MKVYTAKLLQMIGKEGTIIKARDIKVMASDQDGAIAAAKAQAVTGEVVQGAWL